MQDARGPTEVALVEPEIAFGDSEALLVEVRRFLQSLAVRDYQPRTWVQQHASLGRSVAAWRGVMDDFRLMPWGR
jgi:hypothetical protein